jgi:cytochrome d ubiquinol oxidase subunit I
MGISSYQLLKNRASISALKGLTAASIFAAILIPTQIFVGDLHGLNTLQHQPAKVAAMEAIWHDEKGADLLLFAWPDEKTQTNYLPLAIPKGASLILTHSLEGEIQGLNSFKGEHPPVKPVFFGFRIMVGIGMLMLLASFTNLYFLRKKNLPKRLLQANIAMTFSGWVATLAGWYVTEIGRQPWLVQGILKVEDAVTDIAASHVGLSLSLYLIVYVLLLGAFIHSLFYLAKKYAKAQGEA